MKLIKYLFIPVLLTQFLFAQEVPGWVNTGNLADATLIKDFMQLPWSPNIVLACGGDRNGNYHAGLWKSKDKGLTWEYKFWTGEDYDYFTSIRLDSSKYRVWMVGRLDYKTIENSLYYSMDDGDTWTDTTSATIVAGETSLLVRVPTTDDIFSLFANSTEVVDVPTPVPPPMSIILGDLLNFK